MGLEELIQGSNRAGGLAWKCMLVDGNEERVNAAFCGSVSKEVGLTALRDVVKMLLHACSRL